MKVLDLPCHPLDVRSGKWVDLSRKGNHGTPYGGARPYMIAPGVMGYWFDGSGGYVKVADSPSLDITNEITVKGWMKFNPNVNSDQFFLRKWIYNSSSDNSGYFLRYSYFIASDCHKFHFAVSNDQFVSVASSVVEDGKWHFVVGTYDRSKLCIYVDGRREDEGNASLAIGTNDTPLKIGLSGDGIVAEPGVCTRAWSEAEVRENMYRSPIYRMLRGLPHSMIYTKVPWKQTQGGIYVP